MQQVPDGDGGSNASASSSTSTYAEARWSRIPRVQLLRNRTDQRVPLYIDQTVPVWPAVRRSHSSNARDKQQTTSTASTITTSHRGVMRKFAGMSQTVWFRSIKGVLKSSHTHHACNVSEILRECSCGRWSGIEQDLFTCTSVDPKLFFAPDFTSNKKSKGKSQIDH